MIHGVGIFSDGLYKYKINGKRSKEFQQWQSMLYRCYSAACLERQPSYLGCYVSENFKHFQYFAEWANNQIGFAENYNLDKDILVKGNKVYGEDTCVFVPGFINRLLINRKAGRGKLPIGVYYFIHSKKYVAQCSVNKGVQKWLGAYLTPVEAFHAYKEFKESFVKQQAEAYKNRIDPRVYTALLNYEVNIDD